MSARRKSLSADAAVSVVAVPHHAAENMADGHTSSAFERIRHGYYMVSDICQVKIKASLLIPTSFARNDACGQQYFLRGM